MAVYVDNARIKWRGQLWCHLVADSLDELHAFARRLGLQRNWFHRTASYPHYDVTSTVRERALAIGALEGNRVAIMTCARAMKAQLFQQREELLSKQLPLFQTSLEHII
jgi:hypothetical protein